LSVGVLAPVSHHNPWIYAVALLHMSLADGLAAVVGVTWGKDTRYKVFGHNKSFIGTMTFFVVSVGLLTAYTSITLQPIQLSLILGLAGLATVIENIAGYGLDNLLIPLLIGFVLTLS
jgi:dolichol kinase